MDEESCYRPTSILSTLSKIFDKTITNKLLTFLENNLVLSKQQFWFKCGRCTSDVVASVVQLVLEVVNPVAAFLDLKEAFDCVTHPTLPAKLEHYGIRGISLNMIESHVASRTQCILRRKCWFCFGSWTGSTSG